MLFGSHSRTLSRVPVFCAMVSAEIVFARQSRSDVTTSNP